MLEQLVAFNTLRIKLILCSVICGIIVTAAGFLAFEIHVLNGKIDKLQGENITLATNNKILQSNNDVLHENNKKLAVSNYENTQTIQKLIEERADAQAAINRLASTSANDKQTIARLNKRLDEIIKDPKNDGIVSPALRETIRDIQQNRKQK